MTDAGVGVVRRLHCEEFLPLLCVRGGVGLEAFEGFKHAVVDRGSATAARHEGDDQLRFGEAKGVEQHGNEFEFKERRLMVGEENEPLCVVSIRVLVDHLVHG